jgi:hypothetical protein
MACVIWINIRIKVCDQSRAEATSPSVMSVEEGIRATVHKYTFLGTRHFGDLVEVFV